jgi:hypothetical protein
MGYTDVDQLAINTIRLLAVSWLFQLLYLLGFFYPTISSVSELFVEPVFSGIIYSTTTTATITDKFWQVDATFKANSGHPGAPM